LRFYFSGWADGYTAAVFRLAESLTGPCKGLVGPWGHLYPHRGVPGPAIGFLQECVRWWDRWLKDKPTGVEQDPTLRLWLQDSVPPQSHYDHRPGRWIGIDSWPAPEIAPRVFALNPGSLEAKPAKSRPLTLRSPRTTGLAGGEWCAYGLGKVAPELPLDQRLDDAGSLVFDTEPLRRHWPSSARPLSNWPSPPTSPRRWCGAAQRCGARWCCDAGELRHSQSRHREAMRRPRR
jgi:predicted acyl esterase